MLQLLGGELKELLIVALLSLPSVGQIALAHHELKYCASTTATICSSSSVTIAAGSTVFVDCGMGSASTQTNPTDSGGNTYNLDQGGTHGASQNRTYTAINVTGFTGTINCNRSTTGSTTIEVGYLNFTGVTASPIDGTVATVNNGAANASPWTTGTLTTANANDVIVTWIDDDSTSQTFTQPAGFTMSDSSGGDAFAYKIVTATTSASYSWSGTGGSDKMAVGAIGFKVARCISCDMSGMF